MKSRIAVAPVAGTASASLEPADQRLYRAVLDSVMTRRLPPGTKLAPRPRLMRRLEGSVQEQPAPAPSWATEAASRRRLQFELCGAIPPRLVARVKATATLRPRLSKLAVDTAGAAQ